MLNQVVLVGRLVREPEVYETENGKKVTNITLAVSRGFKNTHGEYDTDFIPCTLWQGAAENTKEFCSKGDLLGIKGRLQMRNLDKEDYPKSIIELVAERVTFLTGNHKNETDE